MIGSRNLFSFFGFGSWICASEMQLRLSKIIRSTLPPTFTSMSSVPTAALLSCAMRNARRGFIHLWYDDPPVMPSTALGHFAANLILFMNENWLFLL